MVAYASHMGDFFEASSSPLGTRRASPAALLTWQVDLSFSAGVRVSKALNPDPLPPPCPLLGAKPTPLGEERGNGTADATSES